LQLTIAVRAASTRGIGAGLLLDLDRFKNPQYTYGHSIGDQVLVEVAYRLKESVEGQGPLSCDLGGMSLYYCLPFLRHGCESRERERGRIVATRVLTEVAKPY